MTPLLDNSPLSEQAFVDVEAFLQQGVAENLTLDYKRELDNSPSDRAEMCKDVSALTNSQGGAVIYGIDENQDRTPQLPAFGTPRVFGRQNVEEWAAQVLRDSVQPRMDFEIEAFALPNDPEQCVLVIRTQASPSAPHMVTYKQDNRYYGRFYRRSNFENRIAEEYEVREMMERARRLYLGLEDELERRGFSNPLSPHFGETPYNRRLAARLPNEGSVRASRWVSFLLLPTVPAGAPAVDGSDWLRWLDGNERRYEPELRGLYLPTGPRRPVLGGAVCLKSAFANGRVIAELLDTYLRVGFDGSVEYGFTPVDEKGFSPREPIPYFMGRNRLVRLWQTLGFAAELRSRLSIMAPHLLTVNLARTEGAILTNFAQGWHDPASAPWDWYEAPRCL